MKNAVVITDAPKINYMHNFVALPYYYGTEKYFNRPDVLGIRKTVYDNLNALDEATGFAQRFRGRRVLIKPNLVCVMHHCGYTLDDIPETTDPRVFEAVVSYLYDLQCEIAIVESAGKGVSTMQYYKDTGLGKVARRYEAQLYALEEQPVDRYYVPKAEVQKEVFLPRILSEAVRGTALYVSVPKMKTNLYTGVTLGFKNAMGTLPGNVRYRNHNYAIEKKLVDLLYLFQPALTVIDGIIGGEGLTPAPVDPVKVGMIISGTNAVEVDRVAARVMGFDPETLGLMREARARDFGDPDARVIGDERVVPFRKADCSFLTPRFRENWPEVRYFVGHTNSRAPKIADIHAVTPEMVYEMEGTCRGGCLATMCMYMEMLHKARHRKNNIKFAVIRGNGVEAGGKRYWFDYAGKPYDAQAIRALGLRRVIGCGACAVPAQAVCTHFGGGCCNVGDVLELAHKGSRAAMPVLTLDNDTFMNTVWGMVKKYFAIRRVIKSGDIVDIPFDAADDRIFEIPTLSEEELQRDWVFVPMPRLTPEQIRRNLRKLRIITIG